MGDIKICYCPDCNADLTLQKRVEANNLYLGCDCEVVPMDIFLDWTNNGEINWEDTSERKS